MSKISNALLKEATSFVIESNNSSLEANKLHYAGVESIFRDEGVVMAFQAANSNKALNDDILYYTAKVKKGSFAAGNVELECTVATKAQYEAAKNQVAIQYNQTSHLMDITNGKDNFQGQKLDKGALDIIKSIGKGVAFKTGLMDTYAGTGNVQDGHGKNWKVDFEFEKEGSNIAITKFNLYLADNKAQDKGVNKGSEKTVRTQ